MRFFLSYRPAAVRVAMALLALTGWPMAAAAGNAVAIDEVMAGAFGRPEIQFVEIQVGSCFQPQWRDRSRLAFLDAVDRRVGEFVFPAEPSIPCDSEPVSILIGTQAFAGLASAPDPDFLMPALLVPDSGKVCYEAPGREPVCLSYGSFTGDSQQGSPGNAPMLPDEGTCALQRANPVEFFGETNFNADFDLLPPLPRNRAGFTGTVSVPSRFNDVPVSSPFAPFIEALFNAGVSGGCGNGAFCPASAVTREQMAVFLLRAKDGPGFQPPACTSPVFGDVPCSNPFAPWINELAARGITGGCGGGNYCPGNLVTREQMALFLLRTREGAAFSPPACAAPVFGDVPCSSPFAPWINEIAARGVTGGCGGGAFCPGATVNREQMAVFLSSVFGLPVPSRGCLVSPPGDDHGNTPQTATPVAAVSAAPGALIAGQLERPRDLDLFAFSGQAGQVFSVEPVAGGGFTPWFRILRANGLVVAQTEEDIHGFVRPRIFFTLPFTGTFFLEVRDPSNRETGPYQARLRGPILDDHPGGPSQPTPLDPAGAAVAGELGVPGDVDVFSFPAGAGQIVVLDITTADNLELDITLDTPAGQSFQFDGHRGSFRLPVYGAVAGTYTVHLRRTADDFFFSGPDTGTYTLDVWFLADDHGNNLAAATPLVSETSTPGKLHLGGDVDVFRFDATAGDLFRLTVDGEIQGALVRAADGAVLESIPFTFGSRNPIQFTAPSTGTYLVEIRSAFFDSPEKPYSLTLVGPIVDDHGDIPAAATPLAPGGPLVVGNIMAPGDVDYFSFPATAGQILFVELSDAGFGITRVIFDAAGNPVSTSGWQFVAPATGTYFAAVGHFSPQGTGRYRIRVRGPFVDDHGNNAGQATPLTPGAPSFLARIDLHDDVDYFVFPAVAGEETLVKVVSEGFQGLVNLRVFDGNGNLLASDPTPFSFFEDVLAEVLVRAPATGPLFVRVGGDLGPYRVSVSEPFTDDHGNNGETATPITVDGPAIAGEIRFGGDRDVFAFDGVEGQEVVIETTDLGGGLDTFIRLELQNQSGILASDDDGGVSLGSRIEMALPATGRFLVSVFRIGFTGGTYKVSVRTP